MKTLSTWASSALLAMLVSVFQVLAQAPEDAKERTAPYSQAELDQMLAPVALYPDGLLAQVLMAATYPLEIVQAARWSRAHPELRGEEAVRAVADFDWDPSVKSLVAFPQVLQQMDTRLEWTERLGNAFLGQEYELMRSVQQLRGRAYAAGTLRSSEELTVRLEATDIIVDMSSSAAYVPYYDPRVTYGSWEWPANEPTYWSPWPDYSWRPGYAGFAFGAPVAVVVNNFFFGTCDWSARHVRYAHYRPFYYRNVHRWQRDALWRHDPDHRRGVTYRAVDARHLLHRNDVVDVRSRVNDAPQAAVPSAGVIPRAEVRTNGLARPLGAVIGPALPRQRLERAAPVEEANALERGTARALPPPLHAMPQSHAASPLERPMPAAPQASQPSELARPVALQPRGVQPAVPAPVAAPAPATAAASASVPAAAQALARPDPASPPQRAESASGIERGDFRRR